MRAVPVSRGEDTTPHVNHRRAALFRETPFALCERVALGTAWALKPKRIGNLAPLARLWLADLFSGNRELPEAEALGETSELAGFARDLSSNASKIGFSVLAWHLARWGFVLADNIWLTPTTAQMGFCEMPRAEYLRRLSALAQELLRTGRWEAEAGTKAVADWRPSEAR